MEIIAITGGPCAGKTSAMGVLRERFVADGLKAVFIPEAATDLINAGVAPWTCSSMREFQTRVIALQLEREAAAFEQAVSNGVDLVVCDRGICDSRAYLSREDYQAALAENGITHDKALARYDAVFHLETVAKGDARAYTKENNNARFESAEEAALVDNRVIEAWTAHPAFSVIGNRDSFEEKAAELYEAIARFMSEGGRNPKRDWAHESGAPILVSACLLGEACRYDGKALPCDVVIELSKVHEVVSVCPEQLGGLPTPRTPSEIQPDGRVVDAMGIDRTAAFQAGAQAVLHIARERGCQQAILKENSPSCGVHHVYDGTFSGTIVPGRGKTSAMLAEAGLETMSEADLSHIR